MERINRLFLFLFVFSISHYFSAFTAFSQPLLTGYVTVMYQVPHIIIYFFAQSNKLLSTHLRMSLVLLFSENHRGATSPCWDPSENSSCLSLWVAIKCISEPCPINSQHCPAAASLRVIKDASLPTRNLLHDRFAQHLHACLPSCLHQRSFYCLLEPGGAAARLLMCGGLLTERKKTYNWGSHSHLTFMKHSSCYSNSFFVNAFLRYCKYYLCVYVVLLTSMFYFPYFSALQTHLGCNKNIMH